MGGPVPADGGGAPAGGYGVSQLFWNLGNPVSGTYVYYSGDRDYRQAAGKCPEGVAKSTNSLPGFSVFVRGRYPFSPIARQACEGGSAFLPLRKLFLPTPCN